MRKKPKMVQTFRKTN